jgi:hypothetical protein
LALLLGFRTLEEFSRARSQGNQAFQRSSEITLALLMLLNAQRDLGLPLFQFTRFFVGFVLRNSPLAQGCLRAARARRSFVWARRHRKHVGGV